VDTGFRKTSCSNNSLKRDADSKKRHHAFGGKCRAGRVKLALEHDLLRKPDIRFWRGLHAGIMPAKAAAPAFA
jgi:hypothetical protein